MKEESVRAVEIRTGHLGGPQRCGQVCWIGEPKATVEEAVETMRDVKCSLLEVQWQWEG